MDREAGAVHLGVVEEHFVSRRGEREIPGILWRGDRSLAGPLLLIGHGGSGSSREGYVVALARKMVREHGWTCVAIDGPVHGRRRGERSQDSALVMLDFSQVWSSDESMAEEMTSDWRYVLDELDAEGLAAGRVGYWGLSMGTILGVNLVATEPRIRACVLGLAGATGPTAEQMERDARRIEIPTMFLGQWDDELFGREPVLALFDALASTDKALRVTPGRHSAVTSETFSLTMAFLVDRLSGEDRPIS